MEMLNTFNPQTISQLIFYLLDDDDNFLSVETLTYAPSLHSSLKHLVTLMYPRRHQSLSSLGNLSVRIDAYIITSTTVDHPLSLLTLSRSVFLSSIESLGCSSTDRRMSTESNTLRSSPLPARCWSEFCQYRSRLLSMSTWLDRFVLWSPEHILEL